MPKECFLCTEEITEKENSNYVLSNREKSFLLFQVLDIPENVNDLHEKIKFQELYYCSKCLNRIIKICDMLQDLEELEKNILHEKYQVELHLKKNWTKHQTNLKDNNEDSYSKDQFKDEMVTELRCSSIQSMLRKIKTEQVGRKQDWTNPETNVRFMKDVEIPIIVSNGMLARRQEGLTDELSESILPSPSPLSCSGDVITSQYFPTSTTRCSNFINQIDHSHVNENDNTSSMEFGHPNLVDEDEDMILEVCVPESNFLSHENKFHLDEEHYVEDPIKLCDSQNLDNLLSISLEVQKNFICRECGLNVCDYDSLTEHFQIHANNRSSNDLSIPLMETQSKNISEQQLNSSPLILLGPKSEIFEDNSHSSDNTNISVSNNVIKRRRKSSKRTQHFCTCCDSYFMTKQHLMRHYGTEKHMQKFRNFDHPKVELNIKLEDVETEETNYNSIDTFNTFSDSNVCHTSVSQEHLLEPGIH